MTTRMLLTIAGAFAAWLSILGAISVVSDAAPAYVVVLPSEAFLQTLPEDVAIVDRSPFTITLASAEANVARTLYGNGAWFVLPSGLAGCTPTGLPDPKPLSLEAMAENTSVT